ncbi:MAG TPA: TonB-dependent receptor [Planctomycetota bacterium]
MSMSIVVAAALLAAAQDPPPKPPRDLADLTLEELMRLEVTTASRKEQRLMDTAAAVAVIRGEDIRRMGVRSLPEALRMVPGTHVQRIDGNKWAIGVRGFSDRFANKLQVLVDGRSVYSPVFSGVFWDQQDTFLEDIDRIEVIRGPGGAVWGANAVNGVVNVITKKARDTQGVLAYAGGGTEERAFGGARYGGAAGDVHYRAFAKAFSRDEQWDHAARDDAHDDGWQGRAGFRADWRASDVDAVTILGEYFDGRSGTSTALAAPGPAFVDPRDEHYDASGGHVLLRWERRLSGGGLLSTQVAYAHEVFDPSFLTLRRDTLDVDLTHRFTPLDGHDVVWGAGYRVAADDARNSYALSFDPAGEIDDVVSAFLQDEIALSGDALQLTLGTRVEHNDYTGLEVQPSARIAFRAHERHLIWAAVSRAVRTPNRVDQGIDFVEVSAPGTEVHLVGNHELRSEALVAYEAGYRLQPSDELTFDLALFFNDYDHLASVEPAGAAPPLVFVEWDRKYAGRTYGAELAATWQVARAWRLYGAYTFLRMNLVPDGDSADAVTEVKERVDAKGQAFARSSVDLSETLTLDLLGRYVGPLSGRDVDAYVEADVRLAWRALPSLELSIVGQNLLRDEHVESANSRLTERATEIERGAYFMAVWQF